MISFQETSFGYDGRKVLDGASVELSEGSLHFLTGPSGAGKTTLLKLAYMALSPQGGLVRLFGEDTSRVTPRQRAALRRRIGLVAQECDLLGHMTLLENICLPLRLLGEEIEPRMTDIRALAGWVGLDARLDAYPAQLSVGERRRGAIARAVIATPEIVIADEPTGDVDEDAARRILTLFLELNAAGRTVLIATHDLNLVRRAQGRASAHMLRLDGGALRRAGAAL